MALCRDAGVVLPLTFTAEIIAVDDSTDMIVCLVDSVERHEEPTFCMVALPISMSPKFAVKAARHNKSRRTRLAATATPFVESDFIPVSHKRAHCPVHSALLCLSSQRHH